MNDIEFTALFPTMANAELAALMGVSLPTVGRRARALGLRKDPDAWREHKRGPKSAEHRAKLSAALAGRTFSDETRAKMSVSQAGRVHSDETRARISAGNKGKPKPASFVQKARGRRLPDDVKAARKARMAERGTLPAGEKHYGWKGGIVPRAFARFEDPRYDVWRLTVLERDNYTCQDCGRVFIRGQRGMNAHHLKLYTKYEDVRYDPANGVALCVRCHRNRHRIITDDDYERMEQVPCACGCGETIWPIDPWGKPVMYARYHNRRGKTLSTESRAKISAALQGRKIGPFSDEHRAKMSAGRKGKGLGRPSPNRGWKNTYMTQDEFIAAWPTMTSRQIAALAHVSDAAVCIWAKKLGLPPRYRTIA